MFMNVFALTLLTARAKANGTYNSTLQWLDWLLSIIFAPIELIVNGIRLAFTAARALFGF